LPEYINASLVKNLENLCIQMILKRGTASALREKQPDIDEVNTGRAHWGTQRGSDHHSPPRLKVVSQEFI
jgi:hypothetical protein